MEESGEKPALTHLSEAGEARMVSVSSKGATVRRAVAEGRLRLAPNALQAIREGNVPKGDALAVARVAGIMAAKETSRLIPLCHPIGITGVDVRLEVEERGVRIEAAVETRDRTGVEMEALTAVSVAALALYDMVKAIDRTGTVETVRLLEKSGGKSGTFRLPGR